MDTATTVLKDLGISKKKAIQDYALLNASQKLAEFAQECVAFEKKYEMDFHVFEKKINSSREEIFEQEDDYLAWKFAIEGAGFWREKVERLKSEL
jgi:hypothetical protein